MDTHLLNLTNAPIFLEAVDALRRKTSKSPVLLVFDTLESYQVFQRSMVEGLQGVLEAVIGFLADERLHGLSIKLFLPAEIYDRVIAGFPGKIRTGTVFMRWRAADLIAVLARRYLSVLQRTKAISEERLLDLEVTVSHAYNGSDGRHLRGDFWYETGFLPSTIKNMIGGEEDCFAYLLRHSMRRPRDIITAQMQEIVNLAVTKKEFPYISAQTVVDGVHSPKALEQILGEALAPYEDEFDRTLLSDARTIFYERPVVMTGLELKRFSREMYGLHPLEHVDESSFVDMLLQCGVIGQMTDQREARRHSIYRTAAFEHLMEGNLPLADRLTYCVHPVMANVFGMKRPEEGWVVYPIPYDETWLEEAVGVI
jgi:hypothetical protein